MVGATGEPLRRAGDPDRHYRRTTALRGGWGAAGRDAPRASATSGPSQQVTWRAGAGAAGRRGPDPRDPDQLKEREAKGRRIRRPPGVFVDSGAAADRHASWTTVMASTGGDGELVSLTEN